MPARLFSLYIRCMAYFEKNPGNDRTEKHLLRVIQIVGLLAIGAGIYGLYVDSPKIISKDTYLGWVILSIAKSISKIFLGAGFLFYYKKSLSIFSSYWIFIPMLLYFSISF